MVSSHVGTLSIVVADALARRRHRLRPGRARPRRGRATSGLLKVALAVFPDNVRAIAVYEHAGFVREGLRRSQYRADGGVLRDELLMAWFPDAPCAEGQPMSAVDPARARGVRRLGRRLRPLSGPTYPDELFDVDRTSSLPLPRQPHVVDLGAGTGRASLAMASCGWRVTAVEPGKPMLDVLRGRAANEGLLISTVQASAEETGLDPASADLVTAAQAFHWFDKDRGAERDGTHPEARRRPGPVLERARRRALAIPGRLRRAAAALRRRRADEPGWRYESSCRTRRPVERSRRHAVAFERRRS